VTGRRRLRAAALLLALLPSCSFGVGEFALAGPPGRPAPSTAGQIVTGRDCGFNILGFYPAGVPTYTDALADALRKAPGVDALAEVELFGEVLPILIVGVVCFSVDGRPIPAPR
jgi:hypothetical protein